jgi:hypothetical protein
LDFRNIFCLTELETNIFIFRASQELEDHTVTIQSFDDFIPALDKKNLILAPFCGEISCEEEIKKKSTR